MFQWLEERTADKAGLFSLLGVRYQVGAALAHPTPTEAPAPTAAPKLTGSATS